MVEYIYQEIQVKEPGTNLPNHDTHDKLISPFSAMSILIISQSLERAARRHFKYFRNISGLSWAVKL